MAAQRSVTENISKYFDFLLQPHVLKMKTYLHDTGGFISEIEGLRIPEAAVTEAAARHLGRPVPGCPATRLMWTFLERPHF